MLNMNLLLLRTLSLLALRLCSGLGLGHGEPKAGDGADSDADPARGGDLGVKENGAENDDEDLVCGADKGEGAPRGGLNDPKDGGTDACGQDAREQKEETKAERGGEKLVEEGRELRRGNGHGEDEDGGQKVAMQGLAGRGEGLGDTVAERDDVSNIHEDIERGP